MATSQVETVSTGADKAKLAAAWRWSLLCCGRFYLFGKQGVQWAPCWWGWRRRSGVFLTSGAGKVSFVAFARDAGAKSKRWSGRRAKETIQMTAYVFAFVVIMALFLWLTDKTLEWVFTT